MKLVVFCVLLAVILATYAALTRTWSGPRRLRLRAERRRPRS